MPPKTTKPAAKSSAKRSEAAAKVTQSAKKAALQPKKKKVYRVVRCTQDNHNGLEPYDETRGTYTTYEEAKSHVKRDLDDWPHDFWDEMEEQEVCEMSGTFGVYAVAPEGEEFWVYVKEMELTLPQHADDVFSSPSVPKVASSAHSDIIDLSQDSDSDGEGQNEQAGTPTPKRATAKAPSTSSKPYRVVRRTKDAEDYAEATPEVRGSYATYEEAKAACGKDLTDEWSDDVFVSYKVYEENDQYKVVAEFPEGEVMTVYIDYDGAPALEGGQPKSVYQVAQLANSMETRVGNAVYDSLLAANNAAQAHLKSLSKDKATEENVKSRVLPYKGTAKVKGKDTTVSVVELSIKYSVPAKPASRHGADQDDSGDDFDGYRGSGAL